MSDIHNNPLIAGAMYCCLVVDYDIDGNEVKQYNELVRYGSDGELYDADVDAECSDNLFYYDYLVPQNAGIDNRFIFS